jgi:hypothetical protein
MERCGPVHSPRIDVGKAKFLGYLLRSRTFSTTRISVYGDDNLVHQKTSLFLLPKIWANIVVLGVPIFKKSKIIAVKTSNYLCPIESVFHDPRSAAD